MRSHVTIYRHLISVFVTSSMVLGLTACAVQTAPPESTESAVTEEQAELPTRTLYDAAGLKIDENKEEIVHEISYQTYPIYAQSEDTGLELNLYFLDGIMDMPYLESNELLFLLNDLILDYENEGVTVTMESDGPILTFTKHNTAEWASDDGVPMIIDFDNDTIEFVDYDLFQKKPGSSTLLDLTSISVFNENGEPATLQKVDRGSIDRFGEEFIISAGDYGIDLIDQDGLYLVPLQTFADFLVAPVVGTTIFFNGRKVIFAPNVMTCEDIYYDAPTGERSDELREYGFRELCLMLDNLYGLKEPHEIDSFGALFHDVSFTEGFLEDDVATADLLVNRMITDFLDDGHSTFHGCSYLTGKDDYHAPKGASETRWSEHNDAFTSARALYYPDGVPGYEEVGNTAYITFDEFSLESGSQDGNQFYMIEDPLELSDTDTISLIMKAHSLITRENSPIENVVIDLSCNLGGAADTAVFTIAWFLGEASIGSKNTMTGAMCSSTYRCDANRDRLFDENDELGGRRLFCLTSPVSFSCGNLVPCIFKESGRVTLLGRTSGGGSCVVQPVSTAWGTSFQLSGPSRLSFVMNGAFYDIDRGAEPDYTISTPEQYYDRKALTKFINSIY